MRGIYETTGRAREFSRWALSLGRGCVHGCVYCYVPRSQHITPAAFHCRFEPKDIEALLEAVRQDAGKLFGQGHLGDPGTVLLCFSCDPLQPGARELAREVVNALSDFDVPATILTKAGEVSLSLLSVLSRRRANEFAVTLTLDNEKDSRAWEPGAGLPTERLAALRTAANMGVKTWASLEPVIEPKQTLRLLEQAAPFVEHFKVGTLNYHPHAAQIAREYGWARFLVEIEELAAKLGRRLVVKQSLRKAAGRE